MVSNKKRFHNLIIFSHVAIYFIVSIISTIASINLYWSGHEFKLAVSVAVAYEFWSAATLLSLTILEKIKKGLVMTLFFILTIMQMFSNMFHVFNYIEINNTTGTLTFQALKFLETIFGIEDVIMQKRILIVLLGLMLPLVALLFIKSLTDYLKSDEISPVVSNVNISQPIIEKTKEYIATNLVVDEKQKDIIINNDTKLDLSEKIFEQIGKDYNNRKINTIEQSDFEKELEKTKEILEKEKHKKIKKKEPAKEVFIEPRQIIKENKINPVQ